MNASLVVMAACCVEGFLSDCLKAFLDTRFEATPLAERLAVAAYDDVHSAYGFKKLEGLFPRITGQTLASFSDRTGLTETVLRLFDLRNAIVHGRSPETRTCPMADTPFPKFDSESYGTKDPVVKYLQKKRLLPSEGVDSEFGWGTLRDHIADHFAGALNPYCTGVCNALPNEQREVISPLIEEAFQRLLLYGGQHSTPLGDAGGDPVDQK